jgi:hypothetical protein
VLLGRLVRGGEQHARVVDRDDVEHLETGRRDRRAVDTEPAGVVGVEGVQHPTAGQQRRNADDRVEPVLVLVLADNTGRAGGRVDAEHLRAPLAPVHDLHERVAVRAPRDAHEVGEAGAVPRHLDARPVSRTVVGLARDPAPEPDDVQGDVGVRRPGRGIGDDRGRALGMLGVGDVPALHRALVDPGDKQGAAVGRPPVAAMAVHLLGGDELREPPGDVVAVGCGDGAVLRAVDGRDPQRPLCDVGDRDALRVEPRVDHGRGRRKLSHRTSRRLVAGGPTGEQVHDEEPAGQRERRDPRVAVQRVADDPRGGLAAALAARALLRRELLLGRVAGVAGAEQQPRVDDQPLLSGRDVEHPQAADAVAAVPDRTNTTRSPSGLTVTVRGAPRVKRTVRACWRGNDSSCR